MLQLVRHSNVCDQGERAVAIVMKEPIREIIRTISRVGCHIQIDKPIVVIIAPRRGGEPDGVVDRRPSKDARKGAVAIVVVEKAAAVDPAATPVRHK